MVHSFWLKSCTEPRYSIKKVLEALVDLCSGLVLGIQIVRVEGL